MSLNSLNHISTLNFLSWIMIRRISEQMAQFIVSTLNSLRYSLICFVLAMLLITDSFAQKRYTTTSGEFILSLADLHDPTAELDAIPRFTGFYHVNQQWNIDPTSWMGLYAGISLRNIGYISKEGELKTKRRSYSLGIPVAMKIGSMEKFLYLYGGTELELLFHYKEKVFSGNQKSKSTEWFSNKTNLLVPSIFAGIQLPAGINLKFKWYLRDFMNREYNYFSGNSRIYPFENLSSQIYYLSISFQIKPSKYRQLLKPGEVYAGKL